MTGSLVAGTRASRLATWQTNHVLDTLRRAIPDLQCDVRFITTQGDRIVDKPLPEIGGKGLFTAELDRALQQGDIDIAVHSLKDLPVEDADGLTIGAVLPRADVRDVLVSRTGSTLLGLPLGAVLGTSSLRRQAQLLSVRPDLQVRSIRGNVDTRIRKVKEGEYHAIVLAGAGLVRLDLDQAITEWLSLDVVLPAPGQGAVAVQCRRDDQATLRRLETIDHLETRRAVEAERSFLMQLGGGCSAPIAAYARYVKAVDSSVEDRVLAMDGLIGRPDGSLTVRVSGSGRNSVQLAASLAEQAQARGADAVLSEIRR